MVDLIVIHGGWLHPRALFVCGWGIIHVHLREVLVVVLVAHCSCGLSGVVGFCMGGVCSCGVGVHVGGGVFVWVVGVCVGGGCLYGW